MTWNRFTSRNPPFVTHLWHLYFISWSRSIAVHSNANIFWLLCGKLDKVLSICANVCNDPGMWSAVCFHCTGNVTLVRQGTCVHCGKRSMRHWLRCLGGLKPSISSKQSTRQNNWMGSRAREAGEINFFLPDLSLSICSSQSFLFVVMQHCVFSSTWSRTKWKAERKGWREKQMENKSKNWVQWYWKKVQITKRKTAEHRKE